MSHNDFAIGRADFTIDFWVRLSASGTNQAFFDGRSATDATDTGFIIYKSTSNLKFNAGNSDRITGSDLSANTWYHVALTRSGTSTRLFLNGTQDGSTYSDFTDYTFGSLTRIGRTINDAYDLSGWIDEFRFRIGEAVWTSNFTPPAAPYSEVLLLHANGTDASTTITDSSPQPKTVTAVGNAQLDTAQSKFGGASALFDGTGDYFTVAGAIAENPDFIFGTGDFTLDFWLRLNTTGVQHTLYDSRPVGVSGFYPVIYISNTNLLVYHVNASDVIAGGTTLSANTWYHVALAKFGTNTKLFLNGVQEGSTYTDTNNYLSIVPTIGIDRGGSSNPLNGWIDELRVLKGKAAWTSNFAVPSHEYHMASVARERLLLHGDGVDGSTTITDSSYWARNVVAVGNAQLDTAQKKFGTASMLFDGSGDYMIIGDADDFDIGNNDFTIDFWVRFNVIDAIQILYDGRPEGINGAQITLYIHSDNSLRFLTNGATPIISNTLVTTGTWYHAALTRASGSMRLFLNGLQVANTYADTTSYTHPGSRPFLGGDGATPGTNSLNGWIDEFRIIVGTAHWTSNFIPWPSAYDAPANVLLLHANGADATRAFPDNNDIPRAHRITVVGDTRIDTAQSKFGGSSILFDGAGDYLTLDGSSDFAFGTGDFTIDMWVRFNAINTAYVLYDSRPSGGNGAYILLYVDSSNHVILFVNSSAVISGTTAVTTGTWHHVALARSSGSTKLFLNGTQEGSTYSDTNNYLNAASRPFISANGNTLGDYLNGWLDEIRVKRGEAAWTANFTAPSAAYNPSDGHLLIHGDGPNANVLMIADVGTAAGKTDIIVNADAQVDTAQQKFGTASALFDGTGDYLDVA